MAASAFRVKQMPSVLLWADFGLAQRALRPSTLPRRGRGLLGQPHEHQGLHRHPIFTLGQAFRDAGCVAAAALPRLPYALPRRSRLQDDARAGLRLRRGAECRGGAPQQRALRLPQPPLRGAAGSLPSSKLGAPRHGPQLHPQSPDPPSGLTAFPHVPFEQAIAKASAECGKTINTKGWYTT